MNAELIHEEQVNREFYYKLNCNILKKELDKYKYIKIPTLSTTISGPELAEWLIEASSPQELKELIQMVKFANKRNSDTKAIFQTAAAGLVR